MNTLGFSEDERLSRSDIAKTQLTKAIELFVAEQFIPSITLGGAAEEIFGRLLERRGQKPILEESFASIQLIRDATGLNIMEGKDKTEVIANWNRARNSLKHQGRTDDEFVVLNTCDEAYWMIRRALANSKGLGVTIPNEQDFENWVVMNVNM